MDFYQRVEMVCRQIPYGRVASYGQIALLCGKPGNARQVGYALNHRVGEEIPCHRIVNAKGFLSGAASFDVPGQQEILLEAEGVRVEDGQYVNLREYGWHNTMEDACRMKQLFKERGI